MNYFSIPFTNPTISSSTATSFHNKGRPEGRLFCLVDSALQMLIFTPSELQIRENGELGIIIF